MSNHSHFNPAFFKFLRELKKNNNRPWFQTNKERYEKTVRNPLLDFIGEIGPFLRQINKHIVVDNSPTGGSMFRIYRDTRFAKDKTPYKTHVAAKFPISPSWDPHLPVYYLHLAPGEAFTGGGVWHPEAPVLAQIRDHLAAHPSQWKSILSNKSFKKRCQLEGEKLQRPPKGYSPDHELIETLKYKDFFYGSTFNEKQACSPDFMGMILESYRAAVPFMKFLADALKLPW